MTVRSVLSIIACFSLSTTSSGQVNPDVYTLDNGMMFILLPRHEEPNNVAAGWVAKVGSVNERPGITGMSHFFEHLMFKGTDTIGTNNVPVDSGFTDTESVLRNTMLDIIWNEQYERYRAGEIDDPWDVKYDTPELAALRKELQTTMEQHRDVIVKDEFSSIYMGAGAVGMNAFTSEDVTFYINQLPANKLELWCWMESDRLKNSVFREFFSERDVVHEERRMRTDSSPTGVYQELFNSMFWQASPYSWPVIGWPSDLNSYTLEEAKRYFDIYYQPGNLIGVVVGDFDLDSAKAMIDSYFGTIDKGTQPVPPVPTIEPKQLAPQRMVADVEAQSAVEVRYHGVPFMHKDAYPLEVMGSVLNGKTGRLYKSMVEGEEIANSANFSVDVKKYAGLLSFKATVKGDSTPKQLEDAWNEQVSLLQNDLVSEYELEKVKNNVVADQFRQLQTNFYLMIQLGYAEAIGGWEAINTSKDLLLGVTAEDIRRVANTYLLKNNSSVALFNRSNSGDGEDDELAGFSDEQRARINAALFQLKQMPIEELIETQERMSSQSQGVIEERRLMFEFLLKKLEERIQEINNSSSGSSTDAAVEDSEIHENKKPSTEEGNNSRPNVLQLTDQQLAQANEMLGNLQGTDLNSLKQIYSALQGAYTRVPDDERGILEYVLQKLSLRIAELEN
jgi:predicted Zn-dependent peptidase